MLKISVVTATYNCSDTIDQALNSILSQSYPAVESIVIDGCSSDGTLSILDSYRPRLGVFVSEPDLGIYDALNKGIRLATGDVIGFLHGDDFFENENVLAKVATAFKNPKVEAIYGDLVYVQRDDLTKVVRHWRSGMYSKKSLLAGWMPPHPTFYARRSVYERLGGFNIKYHISADYDLMLRFLLTCQISALYIPSILVRMRNGGVSNRSLKMIFHKSLEDYDILRQNNVGGIIALIGKNIRKIKQFFS
jgi:glycosyltransferase